MARTGRLSATPEMHSSGIVWRSAAAWDVDMVANLFPEDVVTITAPPETAIEPLTAEEELCVRRAVPKRRREFAVGRTCARKALARLGIHGYPLIAGADRAPVWPAAIVGSITHSSGVVGVAVARRGPIRGIGFDVEVAAPLKAELVSRICRSSERRWIRDTAPPPHPADWPKVLFSAKEAVYKCISPLTGASLDFHDVEISVTPAEGRFSASLPEKLSSKLLDWRRLEGKFLLSSSHVFTTVVMT